MKFKRVLIKRLNIFILIATLLISITIYFVDSNYNGKITEFISNNIVSKIAAIFFTLGGIISLFHPFTYKKEISVTDITNISKNTIEKTNEENEINKRIKEHSTF